MNFGIFEEKEIKKPAVPEKTFDRKLLVSDEFSTVKQLFSAVSGVGVGEMTASVFSFKSTSAEKLNGAKTIETKPSQINEVGGPL